MLDIEEQSKFLSGKAVKQLLQVSDNTLRRWANEGKINFIRNTSKGKRYYDITSILNFNAESGKLKSTFIRSESTSSLLSTDSKYKVNVSIGSNLNEYTNVSETSENTDCEHSNLHKKIYAYCRPIPEAGVTKQEANIKELYPDVNIIKSTCSNKDWKYNKILDYIVTDAHANKIDKLILYNENIISKIYYPVIEHIMRLYNIEIVILH